MISQIKSRSHELALSIRFQSFITSSKLTTFSRVGRFSRLHSADVGDYSYCSSFCHLIKVSIGRYTSIGPWTRIVAGIHDYSMLSQSPVFSSDGIPGLQSASVPIFKGINLVHSIGSSTAVTTISDDVWIGAGVTLFSGVSVGRGAVIGANSNVNRDVAPYSIVVGSPGKLLRMRFDESTIQLLESSKWWKYEPFHAARILKSLGLIHQQQ